MIGNRVTKAMVLGGLIGASLGMMVTPEAGRTRKRMLRTGKNLVRRSGTIMNDVADLFR